MAMIDMVLGTVLIGSWCGIILWTVEIILLYQYFTRSGKNDSWCLWWSVVLVMLVDAAAICDECYWVYWYDIKHFGDYQILTTQGLELPLQNILLTVSAAICQIYLAIRFLQISKNRIVFAILVLLSLCAQSGAIYISVIEVSDRQVVAREKFAPGVYVWLALEAATDIIISISLVFYLIKFTKKTTFEATKSVLHRLALLAIKSGSVTSIIAFACVIAFIISPDTNVAIFFVFLLGPLYSCTFIYNLNIRQGAFNTKRPTAPSKGIDTIHLGTGFEPNNFYGVAIERATHVVVEADDPSVTDEKESIKRFQNREPGPDAV